VRVGSMSQGDAGDRRVDAAYDEIIARLQEGDAYGLPARWRPAVLEGMRRKKVLNLAHMALRAENDALPAFLPWLLSGAPAGIIAVSEPPAVDA
ncbi:MAG TPA: hypothetical protein VE631_08550, partial [Alphaproteobacteria bacterium]|nr:hypothetical protein [Alphaproteobacteria bacterium]